MVAGAPMLAEETEPTRLNDFDSFAGQFEGRPDYFMRVTGDSMDKVGFRTGDILAVRRQPVGAQRRRGHREARKRHHAQTLRADRTGNRRAAAREHERRAHAHQDPADDHRRGDRGGSRRGQSSGPGAEHMPEPLAQGAAKRQTRSARGQETANRCRTRRGDVRRRCPKHPNAESTQRRTAHEDAETKPGRATNAQRSPNPPPLGHLPKSRPRFGTARRRADIRPNPPTPIRDVRKSRPRSIPRRHRGNCSQACRKRKCKLCSNMTHRHSGTTRDGLDSLRRMYTSTATQNPQPHGAADTEITRMRPEGRGADADEPQGPGRGVRAGNRNGRKDRRGRRRGKQRRSRRWQAPHSGTGPRSAKLRRKTTSTGRQPSDCAPRTSGQVDAGGANTAAQREFRSNHPPGRHGRTASESQSECWAPRGSPI